MTRFLAAMGILLLAGSTASAQWGYYGGYGVGVRIAVAPPVVAYPVPAVSYYAPAVPYPAVQAYYADPNAPITTKKNPQLWAQVQADLGTLSAMSTNPEPEPYPTYDNGDMKQ